MNQSIVSGNLVATPVLRHTQSGTPVTNIRIAENYSWRDRESGEVRQRTNFHRGVAFGGLAEALVKCFEKGKPIEIVGRLQDQPPRKGKDGTVYQGSEILIEQFRFVPTWNGPKNAEKASSAASESSDGWEEDYQEDTSSEHQTLGSSNPDGF